MKILFLCIYPEDTAPSQRFRFEQFFPYFKEKGIAFDVDCFYSEKAYKALLKNGGIFSKAGYIFTSYFKRLFRLSRFKCYDYIFIQRGASPVGPPVFEYILARLFGKKIIYDFDDAIWMPQDGKGNKFIIWLKCYSKIKQICGMAYKVVAGNEFLASYARTYSNSVVVIPTVVDTERRYQIVKQHSSAEEILVGWTGSHSTIRYLLKLKEVMREKNGIRYRIIADRMPEELNSGQIEFVKWNEKTEIQDLFEIDAGLMPLVDNDWTRGKCGFKAIQYMALGIPALVSPVGVNEEIVDNGISGFVCRNEKDWEDKIQLLKKHPDLRKRMGIEARRKIEECYSINYAFPLILSSLEGCKEDRHACQS